MIRHTRAAEVMVGQRIRDEKNRLWQIIAKAPENGHIIVYVQACDEVDRPGIGLLTEKGKLHGARTIEAEEAKYTGLDRIFNATEFRAAEMKSKETRLRIQLLPQQTLRVVAA